MLAGISHDLRTPLARLRLEAEMSVQDEEAKANMAIDIDQLDAIIDKFMDYARPGEVELDAGDCARRRRARGRGVPRPRARSASTSKVATDTARAGRRRRARPRVSRTCSRTRAATAARPTPASPRVVVSYARTGPWVIITRARPRPGRRPEEARPADHAVLPRRRGAHRGHRRRPRPGDRREGAAAHGRRVRARPTPPTAAWLAHIRLKRAP